MLAITPLHLREETANLLGLLLKHGIVPYLAQVKKALLGALTYPVTDSLINFKTSFDLKKLINSLMVVYWAKVYMPTIYCWSKGKEI